MWLFSYKTFFIVTFSIDLHAMSITTIYYWISKEKYKMTCNCNIAATNFFLNLRYDYVMFCHSICKLWWSWKWVRLSHSDFFLLLFSENKKIVIKMHNHKFSLFILTLHHNQCRWRKPKQILIIFVGIELSSQNKQIIPF